MAYTLLAAGTGLLTQTVRGGVNFADASMAAAAAAGNSFVNDGNVLLLFVYTGTGSVTVSIAAPNTIDPYAGLAVASESIVIPAGNVNVQRVLTPRWPRTIYNQTDGTVHIDYSGVTGLKVAAVQQFRELTQ